MLPGPEEMLWRGAPGVVREPKWRQLYAAGSIEARFEGTADDLNKSIIV
jgi:hypothetical protein